MGTGNAFPIFDWGRELVELVADMVCVCRDGRIAFVNSAGARILGRDTEALIGRPFAEFLHRDYAGLADLPALLAETRPIRILLTRRDGTARKVEIEARRSRGLGGTVVVRARDVTDAAGLMTGLAEREAGLRRFADGTVSADGDGRITALDAGAARLFGWPAADVVGGSLDDLLPGLRAGRPGEVTACAARQRDGADVAVDAVLCSEVRGSATVLTAVLRRRPTPPVPASPGAVSPAMTDPAAPRGPAPGDADDDLSAIPDIQEALMAAASDGIAICGPDRRITAVNKAFCDLLGHGAEQLLGREPGFLGEAGPTADRDPDETVAVAGLWTTLARDGGWQAEAWLRRPDGEEVPVRIAAAAVRGEATGGSGGMGCVICLSDLTGRRALATQELAHANYDGLTGLPAAPLFLDRLAQAVSEAARSGHRLGVMAIELTGLKPTADIHGREVANAVLKGVAERLSLCLRYYDTVARARTGGFTVIMPNLEAPHNAGIVARRVLLALSRPFSVGRAVVRINAAIGIAIYPSDAADAHALIANAEGAMSQLRADAATGFRYADDDLDGEARERVLIWNELEPALSNGEFHIEYQPRIDLATGRITAAEALMRWCNRRLGRVGPDRFIPAIEEAGLMMPFGAWLLDAVCRQQVAWREAGFSDLRVSVNISDRQLRHPGFLAAVRQVLDQTGADPGRLEFEITEDLITQGVGGCMPTLWELLDRGINLVLDDFGSSATSLHTLRRIPVTAVKIDTTFAAALDDDPDAAEPVRAIVGMCHSLGRRVAAEGIETERELDIVRQCGCDEASGFFLCPPLAADALTTRLVAGSAPAEGPDLPAPESREPDVAADRDGNDPRDDEAPGGDGGQEDEEDPAAATVAEPLAPVPAEPPIGDRDGPEA